MGFRPLRSAASAPAQPHPQPNARQQSPSQFPSIANRNKPRLAFAHLDHSQGNNAHSAATATALAACARVAHSARSRSCAIAIYHFCHWDNRLSICRDRLAVDGLHARLPKNALLERLQKSHTSHSRPPRKKIVAKTLSHWRHSLRRAAERPAYGFGALRLGTFGVTL